MIKVRVLQIQRFAIHDGPGIRSTIFFQGCPLRCPWCSNPESQEMRDILSHHDFKCKKCKRCESICPTDAIKFSNEKFNVDEKKCIGCRKCEDVCLNKAISFLGKNLSFNEIFKEIENDRPYYDSSHGGITISGGEAFNQYPQLLELCKLLKEENYHTCIETTLQTEENNIEEIEPYVDLFLVDYKHADAEKLKLVTLGEKDKIKKALEKLMKIAPNKVIVRIPVIPGFNDTKEDIENIIAEVTSLNVKEIHLLPFHNFGKGKYKEIRMNYEYQDVPSMKKEELQKYLPLMDKYSCTIVVK